MPGTNHGAEGATPGGALAIHLYFSPLRLGRMWRCRGQVVAQTACIARMTQQVSRKLWPHAWGLRDGRVLSAGAARATRARHPHNGAR